MPSTSTSGPHHTNRTSWASAASAGTDSDGSAASAASSSGSSRRRSSMSASAAADVRARAFTGADPTAGAGSELQRLGLEELFEPEAAELAAETRLLVA